MSEVGVSAPKVAWFPEAAAIWVDMERGLYDWKGKTRGKAEDRYVNRRQILRDLGMSDRYGNEAVWRSKQFLDELDDERRRRDAGLNQAIEMVEREVGPLRSLAQTAWPNVLAVFEREPDRDDPLALSPSQYVKEYREYLRLGLEVEGKLEANKQRGIELIASQMYAAGKLTGKMVDEVEDLMERFNAETEARLKALDRD